MTDNDQAQVEAAVMELVEDRDQEIGRHGVDLAACPRQHAQRIIERVDELRRKQDEEELRHTRELEEERRPVGMEGARVLELLREGPLTIEQIADTLNQPPRQVENTLDALMDNLRAVERIASPNADVPPRFRERDGWSRYPSHPA